MLCGQRYAFSRFPCYSRAFICLWKFRKKLQKIISHPVPSSPCGEPLPATYASGGLQVQISFCYNKHLSSHYTYFLSYCISYIHSIIEKHCNETLKSLLIRKHERRFKVKLIFEHSLLQSGQTESSSFIS